MTRLRCGRPRDRVSIQSKERHFSLLRIFQLEMGLNKPPLYWLWRRGGGTSPGIKRPKPETDRSGAEVKNVWSYEGDSKSKGKIHLTAVIQVTVSNFTYYFST